MRGWLVTSVRFNEPLFREVAAFYKDPWKEEAKPITHDTPDASLRCSITNENCGEGRRFADQRSPDSRSRDREPALTEGDKNFGETFEPRKEKDNGEF
jgi:hypothetical protein